MKSDRATLLCIYNADGGVLNALADMVHKIVSPATYPCSLCALTYGPFMMRSAWRGWLGRLGMPVLFLYRDEFRDCLDTRGLPLPAVLLGAGAGPPRVLVSAVELAALPDLEALIAMLEARLAGVRR